MGKNRSGTNKPGWCCFRAAIVSNSLSRAAQPVACGPHLAREAILCGPQGLFARLISSLKGLLSIFWQIKRSKPKPSSVWFSRNQLGFAAKTFFFDLHLLLGTDTQNTDGNQHRFAAKTFFSSSLTFGDRYPKYWPK